MQVLTSAWFSGLVGPPPSAVTPLDLFLWRLLTWDRSLRSFLVYSVPLLFFLISWVKHSETALLHVFSVESTFFFFMQFQFFDPSSFGFVKCDKGPDPIFCMWILNFPRTIFFEVIFFLPAEVFENCQIIDG